MRLIIKPEYGLGQSLHFRTTPDAKKSVASVGPFGLRSREPVQENVKHGIGLARMGPQTLNPKPKATRLSGLEV